MKNLCFPLLGVFLFLACIQAENVSGSTGVELIGARELSSTSTLEFRFPQAMVNADSLGPSTDSPVEFRPPLAGSFVWLSSRSGVFIPAQPFTLGQRWQVLLRPGLADASGNPVAASPQAPIAELSTPPFQITAQLSGVWQTDNVPAFVEPRVAFNAAVDLASVTGRAVFRSSSGQVIPAEVRYATGRDYFALTPEQETWEPSSAPAQATETDGEPSAAELPNRLIFRPSKPLTPDAAWAFLLPSEIRSQSGLSTSEAPSPMELGTVQPLRVQAISTQNLINSGPLVEVRFNMSLAPDITTETAGTFFKVQPTPDDLRWTIDWNGLTARGKFSEGTSYQLQIGEGVVGQDGRPFAGERAASFTIGAVKPRLYLPTITGQQLRYGRREFPMRWVNLQEVEFEILRVAGRDLPAAREAMKGYVKANWDADNPDELYQPVPPGSISGKAIQAPAWPLPSGERNQAVEGSIPWNKVLDQESPGAFFITVQGKPLADIGGASPGAQALIQLTDTGLFWKQDRQGLHVMTFSLQSGEPLSGVQLSLWNEALAVSQRQTTDAAGFSLFPLTETPAWLLAEKGEDAEILPMGQAADVLPMWSFRTPVEFGPWVAEEEPVEGWRGLIFTDRPLYRGGETLHVRGFLRRISQSALTLPDTTPIRLCVFSPQDEEVESQEIIVGPDGDFSADLIVPLSPKGEYRLAFRVGDEAFPWWQGLADTTFVVADYQPDAFSVTVDFPATDASSPSEAEVRAAYFFGAPLAASPVRWTLQSMPTDFFPEGFSGFQFLPIPEEGAVVHTVSGEVTLPGGGEPLRFIPPGGEVMERPRTEVLTVEITDLNQQTVAAQATREVPSSSFYLGIAPQSANLLRAGDHAEVRVVAVQPNGEPLLTPIPYQATLLWRRADVLRVQGAGQAIAFQTTTTDVPVGEFNGKTLPPEREGDEWSVASAPGEALQVEKPGTYILRVQTKDAEGRPVVSEQLIYVAGEQETAWDWRNPYQIDLIPERSTVAPGETARILVKNPWPGRAMVFIERGQHILRAWPVEFTSQAPVLEVPIQATDGPNVFVSVMVLRGAAESARQFPMPQFRYGVCALRVENPADKLQVRIQAQAEEFLPGETITAKVQVKDHAGEPVPHAGVTLWAVDEGILALTGYERPDPLPIFQESLPLGVRTGISLTSLLPENPADLEFANKGYLIGGGGIDAAGLRFRENFPATIAWFPHLRTDENGMAEAHFTAPDALTRYRLLAVAHTDATRFGSSESAVTIRQPLSLLSGMGTTAHTGDELLARAVLRNDSAVAQNITWTLEATGCTLAGETQGSFALAAGESMVLQTPVIFSREGTARLAWKATGLPTDGGTAVSDALAVSLDVRSPMLTLRETTFSELKKGTNDLLAGMNPQILEGRGEVRVQVANSRLVGLGTSASYLLEYPYGCAEQTASALVPWSVTALHPLMPHLQSKLEESAEVVSTACARLLDMRSPAGGLGMWPASGTASPWATAWAAVVWAQLSAAQLTTQSFPVELVEWLHQTLRTEPRTTDAAAWTERALILYALALQEKPAPAYVEELLARSGSLTEEARSLLALALLASKDDPSAQQRKDAARGLLRSRGSMESGFDPMSSANRTIALRLLAWVECDPKNPQIGTLVQELLSGRELGQWGNTQANAWALLALNRYRMVVEAAPASGKTKKTKLVEGQILGPDRVVDFSLPPSLPATVVDAQWVFPGANGLRDLQVHNPQGATWFAQTSFAITPPLGMQPAQNRGFGVERQYQKILPDGSLHPPDTLRVGDRVLVTLTLANPQPGAFVALVDSLPAVLEAINPDFRPERVGILPAGLQEGVADFREILSGEVRFFINQLAPGRHVFHYLARVRQAGTAVAPGAKAEEMYRPDRLGLSANETVRALPQQ